MKKDELKDGLSNPCWNVMSAQDFQAALWLKASEELGFKFIAPFTLRDGNDTLTYLGLVPDFGGGTLIIFQEPLADLTIQEKLCKAARAHGYGFSCIELDKEYCREGIVEVLNE